MTRHQCELAALVVKRPTASQGFKDEQRARHDRIYASFAFPSHQVVKCEGPLHFFVLNQPGDVRTMSESDVAPTSRPIPHGRFKLANGRTTPPGSSAITCPRRAYVVNANTCELIHTMDVG